MSRLVYFTTTAVFGWLIFLPASRATDYLLMVMATNEQGYVREVGECAANGAGFGRIISGDDTLAGCFVAATPADACGTVIPAPTQNKSFQCIGGFFAVASRGNCSFAQKAYRVQSSNYNGLIVYNSVGSNFPIEMGSDPEFGPRVRIPAYMVGYDCGTTIIHTYTYEKRFAFLIRIYWSYHDLLRYIIPFVVIVAICFFVMLSAMVVKCVRDKRREMRRRLTKRHLKQIPTKKFVKGEDPETCPICLDDFEDNDKLRILPCGHAYHCRCIDPWLLKSRRVCPICKRKVFPGPDDSSDSENEEANGGAGTSRLAAASERTPLLAHDGAGGLTVGNSTFYGAYTRPTDNGDTSPTPPLNRGRPILLSPASTPEAENQRFRTESESQEPLLADIGLESSDASQPGPFDDHSVSPTGGHVNSNFTEESSLDQSHPNALAINADSVPKGEKA